MADTRPSLAAFDDQTLESVADRTETTAENLEALVARHQERVRDSPGVDDIVYEWRNYFHMDPLVVRTETAYVLAVESHVWDEFAESLDLSGPELDALKAVHDAQARTTAPNAGRFGTAEAVVLTRP
jgi:hypothetical protein